jgi:hypothetical protein
VLNKSGFGALTVALANDYTNAHDSQERAVGNNALGSGTVTE